VGFYALLGDISSLVMLAVSGLVLWASFQRPVDAAASDP
jgi:cytochrome b subunit of formate dehydrogenase